VSICVVLIMLLYACHSFYSLLAYPKYNTSEDVDYLVQYGNTEVYSIHRDELAFAVKVIDLNYLNKSLVDYNASLYYSYGFNIEYRNLSSDFK